MFSSPVNGVSCSCITATSFRMLVAERRKSPSEFVSAILSRNTLSAEGGIATLMLSVCPCITLGYRGHIGCAILCEIMFSLCLSVC